MAHFEDVLEQISSSFLGEVNLGGYLENKLEADLEGVLRTSLEIKNFNFFALIFGLWNLTTKLPRTYPN